MIPATHLIIIIYALFIAIEVSFNISFFCVCFQDAGGIIGKVVTVFFFIETFKWLPLA